VKRQSPNSPSDEHGRNPDYEGEDRCGIASARPGRSARWVQAPAAVLLGIASTRGGASIPPPNPRNRANRHWRWRAYHTCRARSFVRLARVASIIGAFSERNAGPPATRRSCLRSTLTRELAGAAKNPATLSRFFSRIANLEAGGPRLDESRLDPPYDYDLRPSADLLVHSLSSGPLGRGTDGRDQVASVCGAFEATRLGCLGRQRTIFRIAQATIINTPTT
jgi:hypothetical protein